MKLDAEQLDKTLSWIGEKWKDKRCPICENPNWSVSKTVFEMREFNPQGFVVGGPVAPLITVTCNNCGYNVAFNALKIGVIDTPSGQPSDGSGKNG
jgi:hypothetical protein